MPITAQSTPWAGVVNHAAFATLESIRLLKEVEVFEQDHGVWVRGGPVGPEDEQKLRGIPWDHFYEVLPDRRIRPMGRILPAGRLPDGPWERLIQRVRPESPSLALPGFQPLKISFSLIADPEFQPPVYLRASVSDWLAYVEWAPEIRLGKLSFVQSEDGSVIIRGTPLPSMPGIPYVDHDGCIVPAGKRWSPPISVETLRSVLKASSRETILLHSDGTTSRIPASAWVAATRAVVRLMGAPEKYGR